MNSSYKKLLCAIFFLIPVILSFLCVYKADNDIWYLLSEGRYIIQNGIYHIDPLSMHEGLSVVVQNWVSASLLWLVFSAFGKTGILLLTVIVNFVICFLLYKIAMLISKNNHILSLLVMFFTDIALMQDFIVTMPQIFSFVLLLSLVYFLELYIKTDNSKYLIAIPILSFVEANLHASLWLMIFLIMVPYIIDGMKLPFVNTQKYRVKPLIIAFIISIFVGLINPYGYKVMTFIFTSFFDKQMHSYINELHVYSFGLRGLNLLAYLVMAATMFCYTYFRKGNVRVRYICLYFGTMLLGLMSIKGLSHFFLLSIFPFAYFFKDLFPTSLNGVSKPIIKTINILLPVVCVISIISFIGIGVYGIKNFDMNNDAKKVFDDLAKYATKGQTIYTAFNDGGYAEYRGYKPYIDPRAEVFLKINNHKEDIFLENYQLNHGVVDYKEFIDKYNFDYMLVSYDDKMGGYLSNENDNYIMIIDDLASRYSIYARKDLLPVATPS